jgi:predicted phage tail protein
VAVLSWAVPYGDVEDGPTGYVIEAGSASGLADLAQISIDDVTTYQASGVPPGVYYVRVRAVNEMGAGDPSTEVVLAPNGGPGQPTNLSSSGSGTDVTLTWQAPTTGAAAAGYVIEAGSAPGLANLAVLRVGNTLTFSTTAPPGTYYVRVRAVGVYGNAGPASNEIVVQR